VTLLENGWAMRYRNKFWDIVSHFSNMAAGSEAKKIKRAEIK
jgi:hypothetical protein